MTFEQTAPVPEGKPIKPFVAPSPVTVHDLAKACFDAAQGDVKRAARIMERKVRAERALLSSLLEEFIRMTCTDAVAHVLRGSRRAIWNTPDQMPPNYDAGGRGDRIKYLAASNRMMLMQFQLPGGKILGDATAPEVREAASFYGKQAKDMGHKSRWLELIAANVKKNKTVRESLDESKLQELKRESDHA